MTIVSVRATVERIEQNQRHIGEVGSRTASNATMSNTGGGVFNNVVGNQYNDFATTVTGGRHCMLLRYHVTVVFSSLILVEQGQPLSKERRVTRTHGLMHTARSGISEARSWRRDCAILELTIVHRKQNTFAGCADKWNLEIATAQSRMGK